MPNVGPPSQCLIPQPNYPTNQQITICLSDPGVSMGANIFPHSSQTCTGGAEYFLQLLEERDGASRYGAAPRHHTSHCTTSTHYFLQSDRQAARQTFQAQMQASTSATNASTSPGTQHRQFHQLHHTSDAGRHTPVPRRAAVLLVARYAVLHPQTVLPQLFGKLRHACRAVRANALDAIEELFRVVCAAVPATPAATRPPVTPREGDPAPTGILEAPLGKKALEGKTSHTHPFGTPPMD